MNKREQQKEETLKDILEASSNLFQEVGFEKTTIQMIADKCGISKGALYHHFKSKEEVLERISRNYYEAAISMFLPLARQEGRSMTDKLKDIMTIARKSQMNTAATTFVKDNGKSIPSVENALLEKVFSRDSEKIYAEVFAPLFEEGRDSGECSFVGSGQVVARYIHSLDTGMSRQLNDIFSRPLESDAFDRVANIIEGFSIALSHMLGIPKERIDEVTLTQEMLDQYKSILEQRQKEII